MVRKGKPGACFRGAAGFPHHDQAVAGEWRGIRGVQDRTQLVHGLRMARSEAQMAFGNDTIYLEKALIKPRHVEVQILADHFGHIIHLGTRNCSIQRRHQKMIEIAPAQLSVELSERICATAVEAARASNYVNAAPWSFFSTNRTISTSLKSIPDSGGTHHYRDDHGYRLGSRTDSHCCRRAAAFSRKISSLGAGHRAAHQC